MTGFPGSEPSRCELIAYHCSPRATIRRFSLKRSPGGIYFDPTPSYGTSTTCYRCRIVLDHALVTADRRSVQHLTAFRRETYERAGYDGALWVVDGVVQEIVSFRIDGITILDTVRS